MRGAFQDQSHQLGVAVCAMKTLAERLGNGKVGEQPTINRNLQCSSRQSDRSGES